MEARAKDQVSVARARMDYLRYRAAEKALRLVSPAMSLPLSKWLGTLAAYLVPTKRRQVERNLHRITGGALRGVALQKAAQRVFQNYVQYWYTLFHLPSETGKLYQRHRAEGLGHLRQALELGRGAIVALPHLGSWDSSGAWLAEQGFPLSVVAEPQSPLLTEWFVKQRQRAGMEVILLGEDSWSQIQGALRRNRVVCLVSDRDIAGAGVEVEFFGEATTMPSGPALIALRTGAPLLVNATYTGPGRHVHLRFLPPMEAKRQGQLREDIQRITQQLAHSFEQLIWEAPEQWLVLQPHWPSDQ